MRRKKQTFSEGAAVNMEYLIGIDVGTSGTKSVLFDIEGNEIKSAVSEYDIYQPANGWAEQDPEDWWRATVITLSEIIQGIPPENIRGIGLSGQMHGLVMLDADGKVIRNAIIWCDQRTREECREIEDNVGHDRLLKITANPALTGFTASKILWVKKNEPENYSRCRHILLPKDYIRYRLTGIFATDVSDAGGMQLLDVGKRCWSRELLDLLDIDENLLATVYESCEISGYVSDTAAKLIGIPRGIPVAAGAGDNAAAAIGTGVISDGKAFVTIGTSGVVFAHTDKPVTDSKGRVHTFCCAVPGKWHVMGVTQAAGLSLKWFRNNFCPELSYGEIDRLATESPVGSNKLIYLPYLMGERTPHLNPAARGVFFGLSAMHSRKDMLRSVMEGVMFSLCDCYTVLREMNIEIRDIAVCGGGGSSELWRQMIADGFDCGVRTLSAKEGPALGAAILAGVCAGIYPSVEQGCSITQRQQKVQLPVASNTHAYKGYYKIYRDLYRNLRGLYDELDVIECF